MSQVPKFVARQRELLRHEAILKEVLETVKREKNKLQIEHLQLESMLAKLQNESSAQTIAKVAPTPYKSLDLNDATSINKQLIDVTVTSSLTNILEGKFFADDDFVEEEFDEEEEEEEMLPDEIVYMSDNECIVPLK